MMINIKNVARNVVYSNDDGLGMWHGWGRREIHMGLW
jgi:hypothetical protein